MSSAAEIQYQVVYVDSAGARSERVLSDIQKDATSTSPGAFTAYCHKRKERRSFRLGRVVSAFDVATGEMVPPSSLLPDTQPRPIDAVAWRALPAILALKIFTASTRGLGKRELDRIGEFIRELPDGGALDPDELRAWLKTRWYTEHYAYRDGETKPYEDALKAIPSDMLARAKDYALYIAGGSGRKPRDPAWEKRIEDEFRTDPIVVPPAPRDTSGDIGVVIRADPGPERS